MRLESAKQKINDSGFESHKTKAKRRLPLIFLFLNSPLLKGYLQCLLMKSHHRVYQMFDY